MTKDEIKDYRKILEKEFVDKDLEIETTLSYTTIGALGFFITFNEKFIKLAEWKCKFFLMFSILFLFGSFILILYRKSRTSYHDIILMKFSDNMKAKSKKDDAQFDCLWESSYKELKTIRTVIYWTLGIGIGLQIIFFVVNVLK
jgi:hypothetical protein